MSEPLFFKPARALTVGEIATLTGAEPRPGAERKLTGKEEDKQALSNFHLHFAQMLLTGTGYHEPWRLQYLTDLSQLPDYDAGNYGYTNHQGAPVDADGNPVFHKLPKGYDSAQSDGEPCCDWVYVLCPELLMIAS